jgi:hypothetical protein
MEKEAQNQTTLMKINTYLVAFTAAIFNKIVLDDSCTWWWSSKPLQCLSPLGFWHYSVPSIATGLVWVGPRGFIEHDKL